MISRYTTIPTLGAVALLSLASWSVYQTVVDVGTKLSSESASPRVPSICSITARTAVQYQSIAYSLDDYGRVVECLRGHGYAIKQIEQSSAGIWRITSTL
jgi:hypothetical protein